MSTAVCPHCDGQVTLPPGAGPAARAKCPLCEAEYSLSEIYDRLPPMLVLLDAPVPATVAAAAPSSQGVEAFEGLFGSSGATNGEGDFHLAPLEGAEAIDFSDSGGAAAVATAPRSDRAPLRPRKKPKSMAKEFIKIALGGVLGLSIGWVIALWIFGRPITRSEGERKVVDALPNWAKPAALRIDEAAKKGGDEAPPPPNETPPEETGDKAAGAGDEPGAANSDGPMDDAGTEKAPPEGATDQTSPGQRSTPPAKEPAVEEAGDAVEDPFAPIRPGTVDPGTVDPGIAAPPNPGLDIDVTDVLPDKPKTPGVGDDETPAETPAPDKPDAEPTLDPPTLDPPTTPPGDDVAGLKVDSPIEAAVVAESIEGAKETAAVLSPEEETAKKAFTKEKFAAYGKLCEAALSLAQSAADADNKTAAASLAASLAAADTDAAILGQLANAWLSTKRTNDGIVVVATVKAADTQGDLTKIDVELPARNALKALPMTIVCPVETSLQVGDEIIAIGKIVEKAKDEIAGYAGENSRVVWAATVNKRIK